MTLVEKINDRLNYIERNKSELSEYWLNAAYWRLYGLMFTYGLASFGKTNNRSSYPLFIQDKHYDILESAYTYGKTAIKDRIELENSDLYKRKMEELEETGFCSYV